ncbi:MAG: outer membrane lipoprotein carrier protein LolA [Hyphomicrobiaceae bacterium]
MSLKTLSPILATVVLLAGATSAVAQQPAGNAGLSWQGTVEAAPATGGAVAGMFTADETAAIETVSAYFNTLTTLGARFTQTDADGTTTRGRVFVARPGKFRFEYARPSLKVVISDGRFLAIQNSDLQTEETYELNNTPFRMLLRDEVNLLRDAQVLQVEELPNQISLVLRDKDPDAPAAIKVVLTTAPEPALRGWITRDAQGLETKVELTDVAHGVQVEDKLFEREKFFLNRIR